VPGLQPGPGDPVGAGRGSTLLPGLLFFPRRPQVVVVLQQLPDYLPAPLVEEVFQLAGREPGRGGRPASAATSSPSQLNASLATRFAPHRRDQARPTDTSVT
jgi:hypothetical protein